MWTQSIHPGMYLSVRRLRGLSDLVSCTPPAAGGSALGFAGCLAWAAVAGQQASPQPPAHPAPATPPPKNLIGVLFYFHTVNWKWNGEAVFLCAPSCREHSALYKMYLGLRLAETLGVLTETDGGAGHSDGRGSRGEVRANALCSREVTDGD